MIQWFQWVNFADLAFSLYLYLLNYTWKRRSVNAFSKIHIVVCYTEQYPDKWNSLKLKNLKQSKVNGIEVQPIFS